MEEVFASAGVAVVARPGPRGIDVINGAMGLIVLAIGAELIFNGISDFFGLTIVSWPLATAPGGREAAA